MIGLTHLSTNKNLVGHKINMKEKTALDWLYDELFPKQLDGFSNSEWEKIDNAFKKANIMHRRQMEESYKEGNNRAHYIYDLEHSSYKYWDKKPEDFKTYYNNTYTQSQREDS